MPIRIIFRGLVLFNVDKDNGRITAKLIDGSTSPTHGGHGSAHAGKHRHDARIQIFSAGGVVDEPLDPGENVDISVLKSSELVATHASYDDYCPKLSDVIAGTQDPAAYTPDPLTPNDELVRNLVTVNRGTIRVKKVVSWDGGAFPLPGGSGSQLPIEMPAKVKFLGSSIRGYMASECVIDVEDSQDVDVTTKGPKRNLKGSAVDSIHVPPDTVEVLISNFPPERRKALFWSLHFNWMFEAAGYRPASIAGRDLNDFKRLAARYDRTALDEDKEFLGPDEATGFPFPCIDVQTAPFTLTPVSVPALTDPDNRPLCPQGDES